MKRVYFVAHHRDPLMKVGISDDPLSRAKQLGGALCEEFRGGYELEQEILGDLAKYRVHGEWFAYEPAGIYLSGFLRGYLAREYEAS